MKQLINVSISDFKLIFRDASLRIFLLLPGLIYLVVNLFLPWLASRFEGVDEYVAYVLVVATLETTQMFGFIYSMVLIEEKETEVAKVYGVLPVSKTGFVLSRLIIPCLITIIITWILLIIQPFYTLSLYASLWFSILAGFTVPIYTLGIAVLSKNKMEGLVWIKVFNILVVIPIVAFFVPDSFTFLFGIFPTYWFFQGLNSLIEGATFFWYLLAGFVYFMLLLIVTARRFSKVHFA
ncbi:ABC transporter permease [Catalinimonas niigatensis]|uniref:ABC transporter permease n=1 Tax=Catalinimonas niigatensis TaxID=1397264 RepID=UPI002665DC2A|nr:ABC transporter permease [Catalinimonas niigatensis]WPP48034.1 ABC transporter permease [Catalinimonas niigatensis]